MADPDAGLQGLSPRVRGNQGFILLACHFRRSIPACAGEPNGTGHDTLKMTVYPRVCGGTMQSTTPFGLENGLSPRVRGNHIGIASDGIYIGSIPACAGEPQPIAARSARSTVYPRVCGGTCVNGMRNQTVGGLSPRVRGNLFLRPWMTVSCRSIPACAGEPVTAVGLSLFKKVYPRVCGGTYYIWLELRENMGLSPRVRGNQPNRHSAATPAGSIPACAGEPYWRPPVIKTVAVYPRVCGGTFRCPAEG